MIDGCITNHEQIVLQLHDCIVENNMNITSDTVTPEV
jgi:hypothetical protein